MCFRFVGHQNNQENGGNQHVDDRLCDLQNGMCSNVTCCTKNNYVTGLCRDENLVCCLSDVNCRWAAEGKHKQTKTIQTRGPWTLALCLTTVVRMMNGNFLQSYTSALSRNLLSVSYLAQYVPLSDYVTTLTFQGYSRVRVMCMTACI